MPSPVDIVPHPESITPKLSEEYAREIYQDVLKTSKSVGSEHTAPAAVMWARWNGLEWVKKLSKELSNSPIEFRYVSDELPKENGDNTRATDYRQYVWFKANGPISDDPKSNALALAYASDHDLINTALRAEEKRSNMDIKVMVSLDHIIYFHHVYSPKPCLTKQEVRLDKWHLLVAFSPWAGESRALNIGYVYSSDGKHVATCVQEGVLRLNSSGEKAKL